MHGSQARIRTWIEGFKVLRPTIRRPGKALDLRIYSALLYQFDGFSEYNRALVD